MHLPNPKIPVLSPYLYPLAKVMRKDWEAGLVQVHPRKTLQKFEENYKDGFGIWNRA